ncbi:MAG: hypothetical protein KAT56_08480, partial [Sedimentisphaerales bacterium]|nr:hypothetical protein [Sedimentisphaerales bacterium]
MSAIWGWWNRDGKPAPDETMIRQVTEIMRSRGPDEFGFYRSQAGLAMAFWRLSIGNSETYHQTMSNGGGLVQVTLDGKIHNFRDLKKRLEGLGHKFNTSSDTELIVHGY